MARTKLSVLQRVTSIFLKDVAAEILAAQKKFPSSDACLAALTEETGELAKAMLSESHVRIYREAVQVAAMAARCALEGDATLNGYREKHVRQYLPASADPPPAF